jgi:hypothetical protein
MIKIKEDEKENFGELLIKFLSIIHGDKPYEIRFIPEHPKMGTPISILRHGNYLYTNNSKGEIKKVCEINALNFANYIEECCMFAEPTAVCFTVNSPNFDIMDSCVTKNEHIVNGGSINCQFVDIDAPKEIRHDTQLIKSWKRTVKKRILSFALQPSIVIETKNGYHVYWLLENGDKKLFRHIQMQLVQYFDGDEQCINEARLLRLPLFPHLKDPKKPFYVKVRMIEPKNRYTQEELKKALPELSEDVVQRVLKKNEIYIPIKISEARRGDLINLILPKINYVKRYENKITMHCCMPDHPDRNPSAWIDTKYMWFHCSGCGSHYSLIDLAEKLGWEDFIEAWNKYDIDVYSELDRIKEQMISLNDLQHLKLTPTEQNLINDIGNKVIDELRSFGQNISPKHQQYIHDTIQILYKANKDKPYLLPLDMGAGKSLIIKIFLQEMLKRNERFGAVVVVERREDVKRLAEELNAAIGKEIAYPLYGFEKAECLLNVRKGQDYDYCIARKHKPCPFTRQCRYWTQATDQQNYPVVVMTSERLFLRSDYLDEYCFFYDKEENEVKRELLIIDEKPKMIYVRNLNWTDFKKYTDTILDELNSRIFNNEEEKVYDEFKAVVEKVEALYTIDKVGREIVEPLDKEFKLSSEFWSLFTSIYDYTQTAFEIPKILESIVKNGGHREVKNTDKVITTSYYHTYNSFSNFKTVIFDGTADIDIDYQHSDYYFINFESLKTYEKLTIYQCNLVSGSKTSMKDEDKLVAFCEDVKKITHENSNEKIFLPVFKQNRNFIEEYLHDYIESGKIKVAHYGSTRGSNLFKDCGIVVLGGILHKGENYYIGKAMSVLGQRGMNIEDTSCSNYDKVRRFNDPNIEIVKILDMLVDYSQEIKRSKQRDNSKNVEGKVYIFHNDKILLDVISTKFPNCKFEEWVPRNIIETAIYSKSNNKNVQAICDYIKKHSYKLEIYYDEIREAVGLTKQQFSRVMRNKIVQTFIKAHGYIVKQDKKDKRKKKLVKV